MYRLQMTAAALALCAAVAAAGCQRALNSPASPTAVRESASAANADGSNLKVTTPIAINPLFEQTAVPLTPVLAGRISFGRNVANATFSYRFQVADAESFATIVSSGIGAVDASGIARFTVDPALTANKRYVWRFRAELEDAFGPWSNVMAFTTAGGRARGAALRQVRGRPTRRRDSACRCPTCRACWRALATRASRARAD